MTTSITNEYTCIYKSLTLYFRKGDVCCVWEKSGDKDGLLYWPQFFLAHSSTSFASWLVQPGVTKDPKPSVCSWFSLRHPVSNWLKPSGYLVILLSNTHLLPLFFRFFTQVNLLIDSSVDGQYITIIPLSSFLDFRDQFYDFVGYLVYSLTIFHLKLRDHIICLFIVNPRHGYIFPPHFALLEDVLITV